MFLIHTQKKTAKGISRSTVKHDVQFNNYKECLFNDSTLYGNMHRIESRNHKLHVVSQNKMVFNSFDDKRFMKRDNISSFSYGHYQIPAYIQMCNE